MIKTRYKPKKIYRAKVVKTDKEIEFDVFKREAVKNSARALKNARLIHEAVRRLPVHSYERIELLASSMQEPERLKMIKNARSKGYLTKLQFRYLRDLKTTTPHKLPKKANKESKRKRVPQKYSAYIKSKHWYNRRNLYWKTHPRKCAACGTSQHLHLHHMVYSDYGVEPDDHLVGLCEAHHDAFHATLKVKRDMRKETYQFIQEQHEAMEMEKLASNL